jgi:peptide/nickel transport system permease protein
VSRYLFRRVLIAVPSLLGISVVLFMILALAPGDPFGELATNPAIPPEVQAALRAKFGLDDPIPIRYLHWLAAMVHGDWGFSFVSRVNVRCWRCWWRCPSECWLLYGLIRHSIRSSAHLR